MKAWNNSKVAGKTKEGMWGRWHEREKGRIIRGGERGQDRKVEQTDRRGKAGRRGEMARREGRGKRSEGSAGGNGWGGEEG